MWKNNQSGRTMIEVLAVLAIMGLVGSGLITMVTSVYNKYRISSITTQIKDLQKNIRTRYSALGNYADLGNAETPGKLIKEKVVPSNMLLNDGVVHAFGSDVVFNADTELLKDSVNGAINKYSITFKDVRKEACVELLNLSWDVNETSDLVSVSTRNQTYSWESTANPLPMKIDTVYQVCGIAAGKDPTDPAKNVTQDITWIFQ